MKQVTEFKVDISPSVIDGILDRVRDYPWFDAPQGEAWEFGCNTAYLKDFCAYWLSDFDWPTSQTLLNRYPQFQARIEDYDIHFIREEGSGNNPVPLLICHGWPGSVFEFWNVIDRLAHPEKFGGTAEDGRTVIVPSLPGFGFSSKPKRPIGPRRTAELFNKLMTENLGYDAYIAQGGDWGCMVVSNLGYRHDASCKAIHLNMLGLRPKNAPDSDEEKRWAAHAQGMFQAEGAYFLLHATKPQSLAFGMMDSPVGIAAWLLEKFQTWSDLEGGDLESVYTKDQLLTNIMIYLVSGTFHSSLWFYRGSFEEQALEMDEGRRVTVPTGIAAFADKVYPMAPRSYVEKGYSVVQWDNPKRGGHFAAFEQPELFADCISSWLSGLKHN